MPVTRTSTRWRLGTLAPLAVVLMGYAGLATAGQAQDTFLGRPLSEALRTLQRRGLQIVFSSEIVTPEMRVLAEPRATTARQQLDELLQPHGLKAERGPGSVIQVVRVKPAGGGIRSPRKTAGITASIRGQAPERVSATYAEQVIVRGSRREREDRGVASTVTLDPDGLQSVRGVLEDDPLHAVHALPRVAAVDDFRSEFSVRGSPYRHVGVVVDGVATSWLRHTVHGRSDVGSLSMLGSDSLEGVTLQAGAYPQRYGDRLGAQLEFTLREGSRESNRYQALLGGTSAAVVAEGPIGGAKRGSWILSLRNSYLDWPVRRQPQNGLAFAFADAHAKLVYDVGPTQQLTLTALAGRSKLDAPDWALPDAVVDGTNRAVLLSVGWRRTLGSRAVIRQRASVVAHEFLNRRQTGHNAGRGRDQAFSYRGEIFRALVGGRLEAGGELRQVRSARRLVLGGTLLTDELLQPAPPLQDEFGGVWSTGSAYANFDRTMGSFSLAGGLRLTNSTLVHDRSLARWVLADWSFKPGWTLNASVGVSHQFPEIEQVRSVAGSLHLKPERATHVDVGLEQRLPSAFRWQATLFNRAERDVLREPGVRPGFVDGVVFDLSSSGRYENALGGTSRGVELLVAREGAARLSGWVSYSYGTMRHTDAITHEIFWGDLDRRHALNAVAVYRASDHTSIGIVFRGSTSVPIPGYLAGRDGGLFVGERRNEVRLSHYARLDARAQRAFTSSRRRVTLFAEVLNVLNRENHGPADGVIQRSTGEAVGFTRALMPRRASAGVAIGF